MRRLFRAVCRRSERKGDAEDETAARVLVDRNPAAVYFDGPFRDRQAETGSTARPRARFVEAEEAVENPLAMGSCDTGTLIGDFEDRLTAVRTDANVDP